MTAGTPDPTLRMLDDLIHGRWVLTLEPALNGGTEVVAYRPIGWTGPGDPHERLAAPDHAAMRDLLTRRHTTGTTDTAEQTMTDSEPGPGSTGPMSDLANDPIPDDLTDEEKDAVRRQGDVIAHQRALRAPLIGEQNRRYAHGD
ncbi:hypothetical protein SUDANB121_01059 [Nocardiopsis dassonvillei]|uniref:hypothetical protein n=1 Tax=Nocardiopsis dassonvillei TaxID=2014 RepID=UPI003F558FA5